jgi:hypothetical protein
MKLVARRLRRAAAQLLARESFRDRLELIVYQAQQQGLQPSDFASAAGEDAIIAIATSLPSRARVIAVDTESYPKTVIVDSFSHEYKTAKENDFKALYSPPMKRVFPTRSADERSLSPSWQRVLQHALGTPK